MTDTLDGLVSGETEPATVDEDDSREPGEFAIVPPTGRRCKLKGCTEGPDGGPGVIPDGSAPARKYCDTHFVGNGGKNRLNRRNGPNSPPTGEKAPKLVVQVGKESKGKADQRVRDTAQGAEALMNLIATGMAMTHDNVCATAVAGGAKQWGDAVGELSKYQPWLQQFFAPAGGDSPLGAWLGFLMATGAIALPVLAHHNMLPASVGAKLGGIMVSADDLAHNAA